MKTRMEVSVTMDAMEIINRKDQIPEEPFGWLPIKIDLCSTMPANTPYQRSQIRVIDAYGKEFCTAIGNKNAEYIVEAVNGMWDFFTRTND
jgi:hypothetical protein